MTPKQKAFVLAVDKVYAAQKFWIETGKVERMGALGYYYKLVQSGDEIEAHVQKLLLEAVTLLADWPIPVYTRVRFHVQADILLSGERNLIILTHSHAAKEILKLYRELSLELELNDGVVNEA